MEPAQPQLDNSESQQPSRVRADATALYHAVVSRYPKALQPSEPPRQVDITDSTPPKNSPPLINHNDEETIYYLAYGSNLCAETFRGKRGINPISEINVCVPSLRLTFDLAGFAYSEPCFGNTAKRDPNTPADPSHLAPSAFSTQNSDYPAEKHSPLHAPRYHKDAWRKPLVGVLYELTVTDYARVIATEGGGASYKDIIVTCYKFPASCTTVPWHPEQDPNMTPVSAHTLFAPHGSTNDDPDAPVDGRLHRPDPSYAQPSARYLKLIRDGAREHAMPAEYREFLDQVREYKVTTFRQRVGAAIFKAIWMPFLTVLFMLMRSLADEKGRAPEWLTWYVTTLFSVMWKSYDNVFKGLFGDGERTIGE